MAISCDQMGTRLESREEQLLERQAAVAPVTIRKNKSETISASCHSLPPSTSTSFPCTLMEMINWSESEKADKEGVSLSICWAPDGRYFTINDHEKLSKHVLKRFFKDSKFDSFQRKLYRWGFKQVPSKRDSSRRRQGNVSFYADGFERDGSSSCTKLKVRYSKKEKEEKWKKYVKAKIKKIEMKSNARNNMFQREDKLTSRLIGNTRCNYMAVPRGMCTSRADIELGPVGNMFTGNVPPNTYSQFATLAEPDYLLFLRQQQVSPMRNLYCGASLSSASCQLSILHQQRLLLKQRSLAKMAFELRTVGENNSALHGAVCKLRELQRLAGLSLQMCSSIPRASPVLPYYPIELAQPPLDVMYSPPQVPYPDCSAFVAGTVCQKI
jgi:hypothetical protein